MTLTTELIKIAGKENVLTSAPEREMYAYDSSPFISKPAVVVFVSSAADVSRVVKLAKNLGIPVMPRGAGTCLSGGAVPAKGGISLVMTRMNQILSIDPFSRTALVEPGVVNLSLQKALAPHDLIFPPDPASQKVATIGGNVAECAGGIQGARYGVTKNYVLGLELVLSDGTITTTGLLSKKESLGPDMTGIFNGSEGALAVITKILVSCLPAPQSLRTALASFGRLADAARAVSQIIKQGIIPTALELMDQTMLRAVDDFTGIGFPLDAKAVLLMEVDGWDLDLDRQLSLMEEICKRHDAKDVKLAASATEREKLWTARRSGNGALGRIRPAYIVHDVTVPRHRVADLLTQIHDIGKAHGIIIAQMAHAGDGNAHPHLLYHPDEKNIEQRLHDATKEIFHVALELGGTISGEHGIGLEKKAFMGMQFSQVDLAFMKRIQRGLDPFGILNPGKIFPTKKELSKTNQVLVPAGDTQSCRDNILEFYPENLTLKVRGETLLKTVQEKAAQMNAFIPLCPHTQGHDTMGHLVETGALGHEALALGSLKEYIFGLEFTCLSGDRITTGGHTAKNVAGFDFTRFLWKGGGSLGKIETITLKLLPNPESRCLIIQEFADLEDCMAQAETILASDLCLCTLKANSQGSGNWQLVSGLMGSAILVEQHAKMLMTLDHGKIKEQGIFDLKVQGEFWKKQFGTMASYPTKLFKGCGLRTPMFAFLKNHYTTFSMLETERVDLDIGCSVLSVRTSEQLSVAAPRFSAMDLSNQHYPGFYVKSLATRLKAKSNTSLIHGRIQQAFPSEESPGMPRQQKGRAICHS